MLSEIRGLFCAMCCLGFLGVFYPFRVQGFGVKGLGFRVQGLGFVCLQALESARSSLCHTAEVWLEFSIQVTRTSSSSRFFVPGFAVYMQASTLIKP